MTVCEGEGGRGEGVNYQTAKTSMTSKCKNLNEINPQNYNNSISEAASYIVLEKKYYLCKCTKAIKKKMI